MFDGSKILLKLSKLLISWPGGLAWLERPFSRKSDETDNREVASSNSLFLFPEREKPWGKRESELQRRRESGPGH